MPFDVPLFILNVASPAGVVFLIAGSILYFKYRKTDKSMRLTGKIMLFIGVFLICLTIGMLMPPGRRGGRY